MSLDSSRRADSENVALRQTRDLELPLARKQNIAPPHARARGPGTNLVSACLPGGGGGVAGRSPAPHMLWQPKLKSTGQG